MKKSIISLIAYGLAFSALQAADLQKCIGCHGSKFEKPALGKSKIVKNMKEEDIVKALKGYKNGTYGGPMKGIMKGQVQNIDNPEEVAKAIKDLNIDPIEKKLKQAKKEIKPEPKNPKTEIINMRENALNVVRDCMNKANTLKEIEACTKH